MISPIRISALLLVCILTPTIGNAQQGDKTLETKSRALDYLFPIGTPQRPYFFKLTLRFVDADTQVVIVVHPDKEKYWIKRCEVTRFSLGSDAKKELSDSLATLSPDASDDALRSTVSKVKVSVTHDTIAPEALDKFLDQLRAIRIPPTLDEHVSVDQFSQYEFWYDNWQDAVHYSLAGPPKEAPQDALIRWMVRFNQELPTLLREAQPSK